MSTEPFGIIYRVLNIITGKSYIGQTTKKLQVRINEHIKVSRQQNPQFYFQKSLKKHNTNNFEWSILCECETKY